MFDQLVSSAKVCRRPMHYFSLLALLININSSALAADTALLGQKYSAVVHHYDYLAPPFSLAVLALPVQSSSQKPNANAKSLQLSSQESVRLSESTQYPQAYQVQSLDDYRGSQVYLEFWDSACGFCLKQLKTMAEMNVGAPKKDIKFLSISVDKNPRDALRIIKNLGLNFPVLSDPSGHIAEKYGVSALPTAFLISKKGIVKRVYRGLSFPPLFEELKNKLGTNGSRNG